MKYVKSGNTLWNEMAYKYQLGVDDVRKMQQTWNSLKSFRNKSPENIFRKICYNVMLAVDLLTRVASSIITS